MDMMDRMDRILKWKWSVSDTTHRGKVKKFKKSTKKFKKVEDAQQLFIFVGPVAQNLNAIVNKYSEYRLYFSWVRKCIYVLN